MPYFNAWINAEGDNSGLSGDCTEGGCELNSWAATVGFDVDITPTFTAGQPLAEEDEMPAVPGRCCQIPTAFFLPLFIPYFRWFDIPYIEQLGRGEGRTQ